MATIVEHEETGTRYVLLGAGLGMLSQFQQRKGLNGSGAGETTARKIESVIAVCNDDGDIGWFKESELLVVSVNDVSPHDILLS